jgi:hypothetical protein
MQSIQLKSNSAKISLNTKKHFKDFIAATMYEFLDKGNKGINSIAV